jgi:mRNA-degrading endonuclease RelE of RelBE toxin-antitoxin system
MGGYTPLAYSRRVIFLETPIFTRQINALVDDDQYRQLQLRLLAHPDAGDLIPGSGGLRKVRMAVSGRGKRGGARIIYYWITANSQIYMPLAYAKSEQDDLSEEQLKTLRTLVRQEFG